MEPTRGKEKKGGNWWGLRVANNPFSSRVPFFFLLLFSSPPFSSPHYHPQPACPGETRRPQFLKIFYQNGDIIIRPFLPFLPVSPSSTLFPPPPSSPAPSRYPHYPQSPRYDTITSERKRIQTRPPQPLSERARVHIRPERPDPA